MKRFTFTNQEGEEIAAAMSEPEDKNGKGVLLLHCFTCTKHHRVIRNISKELALEGFTTLRIDFSGSGKSQGKIGNATYDKMIKETKQAFDILNDKVDSIGIGGHSLGAMVSLLTAPEIDIDALSYISGSSEASRVRQVFDQETIDKVLQKGEIKTKAYKKPIELKKEFLENTLKHNVGKKVTEIDEPILVIHGEDDDKIPAYKAKQVYYWATEPKEIKIIDGGDHLFTNNENLNKVVNTTTEWFKRHL